MLLYEIKKIFVKRVNRIALVVLVVCLAVISYWTIRDVEYLQSNGVTLDTGRAAAQQLKEDKNQWKGYLTEEILKKVIVENTALNVAPEALGDDTAENNKVYAKKQAYMDIRDMISDIFSGFDGYDYYKADNISVDEVSSLYEQRVHNLEQYLIAEENAYSEEEKQFLTENYESLETPFYYEAFEGWKALLDSQYFSSFITIVILVCGLFGAGIFSDEFTLKTDSIFFSTKLGRGKAVCSKCYAGVIVTTCTYWVVVGLYSAIVLGILGTDGANCPIQIYEWDSTYNISNVQYYLFTVMAGYVGCMFIIGIAMLVSAKTHSAILSITIPFMLTCVTPFLGRIPVLRNMMELCPEVLIRLSSSIDEIKLVQVGENVFRTLDVMMFGYAFLAIGIIPLLYFTYRKTEVK